MNWETLLSERRRSDRGKPARRGFDLRSEFEKDYHRIIGSASFRRLQDKTQVFPLDRSDFIRTRLTHSLEVSSVARSLGENISEAILTGKLDPEFDLTTKARICEILSCAGLIHDIGNPPFGHFGEEAIREWFARNLGTLEFRGKRVADLLSGQQRNDLLSFEGNAQGLRLVTKLHFLFDQNGMDLTFGLLSAVLKYPTSSVERDPASGDIRRRKTGYFCAEEELYREIQEACGTNGARNPLTYILEAADDIAYSTADIEDAFKKGFFDYTVLLAELKKRRIADKFVSLLPELYERGLKAHVPQPGEYAVMNWLVRMQGFLMASATEGFTTHYRVIMRGGYPHDLFYHTDAEHLLAALKGIAYDYAFTSASIFRTEIAANTILSDILDKLVPSLVKTDEDDTPGLMEEKYISLISENYKQVYRREAKGKSDADRLYLRLLLVTDSVSGMTDSYAADLYREMNGFPIGR